VEDGKVKDVEDTPYEAEGRQGVHVRRVLPRVVAVRYDRVATVSWAHVDENISTDCHES